MNPLDFPRVTLIGAAFAGALRMELSDEWWAEMRATNRDNAKSPDPLIAGSCASHDHCDANMSMLAGFQAVMGREPVLGEGPQAERDLELMNAAWDYAKTVFLTAPDLAAPEAWWFDPADRMLRDENRLMIARDVNPSDAPVIVAAPRLLAALRGMVDAYWRGSEDSDDQHAPSMVKDALAAIALAETGGADAD